MLVRRKRPRNEAFPSEIVLEDGDKKSKCTLLANSVTQKEIQPRLKQLIDARKHREVPTGAIVRKLRDKLKVDRLHGRTDAVQAMRADVFDVGQTPHDDLGVDLEMDKAIFTAFQSHDFSQLLELIDGGRTVDFARPYDGTTGLMAACFHGDLIVARNLLDRGADPDRADIYGNSPKAFARAFHDPVISHRLSELLSEFEYVYDVYMLEDHIDSEGSFSSPTYSVNAGGMLYFDENSGRFIEYAHHENDEDFGRFGGEDSDSNASGYYERHMYDEDDYKSENDDGDYGECGYGHACRLDQLASKLNGKDDSEMMDFN